MRDLQLQLESQLQNEIRIAQDYQTQLQKEREHRLTLESQMHQEQHCLRHELSEVLLAKEDLEKLTEQLIKKVVINNDTLNQSEASFTGAFTLESRQLKPDQKRTTSEVLKLTAFELREMSEVLRELSTLLTQIVTDKRNIQ